MGWPAEADWTEDHIESGKIGSIRQTAGESETWRAYIKTQNFALVTSLDQIANIKFLSHIAPPDYLNDVTDFLFYPGFVYGEGAHVWDEALINGKHYDGVNNWAHYLGPSNYGATGHQGFGLINIATELPQWRWVTMGAYRTMFPAGIHANSFQNDFVKVGIVCHMGGFVPGTAGWAVGDGVSCPMSVHEVLIRFFNAACNSISRNSMKPAGGVELKLYGLGFDMSDDEIEEGGDPHPFGWSMHVDEIHFLGLQAQGNYVLTTGINFIVDSDAQITIPAMPAMAAGTYEIRIRKLAGSHVLPGVNVDSYAGDFRADACGWLRAGDRIIFEVTDVQKKKKPILKTRWKWKKRDGAEAFRYYSPIDISTQFTFWDGRLLGISDLTRAIDDRTGLFDLSDCNALLANTDMEFSKLLAEYFCKNQIVDIWYGWADDADALKQYAARFVVWDYDRPGLDWKATLVNPLAGYVKRYIPEGICGADEFPNIHKNHIGRAKPDVIGKATLTTGQARGAVEAVYTDTVNFQYLAAGHFLTGIDEVYSENALVDPADYHIDWDAEGQTFIHFNADQGENKVTFNSRGYPYELWDSANGYVQNPAYVILFYLMFLIGVPETEINTSSFDDVADLFDDLGVGESCYVIMQERKEASAWLQELLYTCGAKLYLAADGRLALGRKDISNFASSIYIFEQIDALEPTERVENLNQAVNRITARWNHYPSANTFLGAKMASRQVSIDDFGAILEASTPWDFPWTDSEVLVDKRVTEELLRFGYGNKKIKLKLAIEWLERLDIFTSFRYQDPFGLSLSGGGEQGRYFYVTSISPNFEAQTLDIEAEDLQWLLQQYFVLGDRTALAANWAAATPWMRMYGYLADRAIGLFPSDSEPGKVLADRTATGS